jgi:hypothetical protein
MATWYLDPEGGNDASAGTSFATRRKNIGKFLSTDLAAGDTIRVIASRDPNTIGNVTWTDNSGTLTLASAISPSVDTCDSGWTGVTNSTVTHSTTRVEGTNCVNISIAAGFTTGKAAYKALGSAADLSAYQCISFRFKASVALPAGVTTFRLDLCSDAAGDTPLASLSFNRDVLTANSWQNMLLDYGSALPSGINSIALYALADPGTVVINLDNIIACKAVGASNHLSHRSLIGKNTAGEPEWWPIMSINGTSVILGHVNSVATSTQAQYRGTTETVASYALPPIAAPWNGTNRNINKAGTSGSPITISGGWNRTDMSTQTGVSWLSGEGEAAYMIYGSAVTASWLVTRKLGLAHSSLYAVYGPQDNQDHQYEGIVGCGSQAISTASSPGKQVYDLGNVLMNASFLMSGVGDLNAYWKLKARRVAGCNMGAGNAAVLMNGFSTEPRVADVQLGQIDGNSIGVAGQSRVTLKNTVLKNNGADVALPSVGDMYLHRCSFQSSTLIYATGTNGCTAYMTAVGGDKSDNRQYGGLYTLKTDATTTHSGSGVSWKMSVLTTSQVSVETPVRFELAALACKANVAVNFKAWLRRDNTGLALGIMTDSGGVAGVGDQSVAMSAAANTWEQVTLSFTPTEDGIVPIYAYGYGGTTYSGWFDDLSVS